MYVITFLITTLKMYSRILNITFPRDVQQLFYFYDKPYMAQYQLILTYRQKS